MKLKKYTKSHRKMILFRLLLSLKAKKIKNTTHKKQRNLSG